MKICTSTFQVLIMDGGLFATAVDGIYHTYIFNWTSVLTIKIGDLLAPQSILVQLSISIPPENVRKPKIFWRFQGI